MLTEIYTRRDNLANEMKSYLDRNRSNWTSEHENSYQKMEGDFQKMTSEIRRLEQLDSYERDMSQSAGRIITPNPTEDIDYRTGATGPNSTKEYRDGFNQWMRTGNSSELRSMNISSDPAGGFSVPETLYNQMVKRLNVFMPYRLYATVIPATTDKVIPVPNDDGEAYWTGEEQTNQDSDDTMSAVVLGGHKLQRLQKVSEELVQDFGFDLAAYLADRFALAFSKKEEPAYTTGTGVGQPTGWTVDAEIGTTAAEPTEIDPDELIDMFYSLKSPYRVNGVWMLNDKTAAAIRKMKDGNGQWLWSQGLAQGQPDTILGRPVAPCQSMPDIGAGTTPIGFGDLSYYYIVDRGYPIAQRLNELYAGTGQVGFRLARRMDGKLTISEAVKKLKMAAS